MNWQDKIFSISNEEEFERVALEIFRYQAENNAVYREYLQHLKKDVNQVKQIIDIPFLPIEFFKSRKVVSGNDPAVETFTSSGTTGILTSRHFVPDVSIYEKSFTKGFEDFYGSITDYCVLALLPSYLEREGSSLIYMMEHLIRDSKHPKSGFYLHNHEELIETIADLKQRKQKILLLGVSFALLDLAENYELDFSDVIIMETGGMKGRRKEITREELHKFLCTKLGVSEIHSEYGMTELLSQAYSKGRSLFHTPNWMKILIRDTYDPFSYEKTGRTGGVNVIDLANVHSCSFIETQDLGKIHTDGSFEILGRFDHSDIRGCNLLVNE
ncbi:acyl transferase [Marinifilum caeruleilacunae]|uniref:Acyl transferase n=1 Tax=Marinifilum caeruleilacunae TaxID=2499076 RepID=A0ABX1WXX9_9BACT|nr:acyl transferase [Marinifilum caeruleilacunae]NOU60846.1 acyl transferase [Marinifilum caeruleilacunae]